jgi:hypothetical protein
MIRIVITGPEYSGKTNGEYKQFDLDQIAEARLSRLLSSKNAIPISMS